MGSHSMNRFAVPVAFIVVLPLGLSGFTATGSTVRVTSCFVASSRQMTESQDDNVVDTLAALIPSGKQTRHFVRGSPSNLASKAGVRFECSPHRFMTY